MRSILGRTTLVVLATTLALALAACGGVSNSGNSANPAGPAPSQSCRAVRGKEL